jgi:RNA polymerase sigma-70 factor (ECF subfamily)
MTVPLDPDDDDLLRRTAEGDPDAFTVLYRRWQGPLFRFALRMTGSAPLAEDVVQEVFVVVMRQPERFDAARGTVSSFLYGVARNHVLRRLERERPYRELEDADREAPDADVLGELVREQEARALWTALLVLPAHYREVVVLCDLQSLEYADAAAILGCAVGTVRSRLHRGRAMLAERLRGRPRPNALSAAAR